MKSTTHSHFMRNTGCGKVFEIILNLIRKKQNCLASNLDINVHEIRMCKAETRAPGNTYTFWMDLKWKHNVYHLTHAK